MRKRNKGRKLSRPKNQREALMRTLASSLFLHGQLQTTEAKAKELRITAEKFISQAKKNTIVSKRTLAKHLSSAVSKKLFEEIALQYMQRNGGYTKIVKTGLRKSDGARMAIIKLIK